MSTVFFEYFKKICSEGMSYPQNLMKKDSENTKSLHKELGIWSNMSRTQAINNPNQISSRILCKTDKTSCLLHCPKCEYNKRACKHTKAFKKPESVWRHFFQTHILDVNEYPNIEFSNLAFVSISTLYFRGSCSTCFKKSVSSS